MSSLEKGGFFILYLLLSLHNKSSATSVVELEKEVTTQQLPRVTVPISYEIKIVPAAFDEYRTFHGESAITVRVLEETHNVTLHSKNLWVDENFTSLVDVNGKIYRATKHIFVNEASFLVIEFDEPISAGIYTLNLNYTGEMVYGIDSHYYMDENTHRGFIATNFYPSKARTAFPCWDDINYRATFNLSIKHHPNLTAMSNTPVHQQISDSDGKIWTNFETTLPIPIYRLEFVLSEFHCVRSDDKKFSFCGRKTILQNLKNLLDITQRVIPILERYIDVPYTKREMNQFVSPVPGYRPWTYMAGGPVKYTEFDFEADNMVTTREKRALAVARNVAYELLSDAVTVTSFNNSWIVEKLSYYLGYCVVDELHPEWREMDSFVMNIQDFGFDNDDLNMTTPLESYSVEYAEEITRRYWVHKDESSIRGAALFYTISNFIGKNIFTKGIHEFVQKASRHSITSDDLWDEMQLEFNKNEKEWHFNVQIKKAMKSWTNQAGYPIVNVTRDYETGRVGITQEGYPIKSNRFWIPMNFATKSNPNFMRTSKWWLNPRIKTSVINDTVINEHDWIISNMQQSAYYRVDYDETNWNRIAEYMHTKQIPVRTRAQLINDLSFMVRTERQNITTFLNFARYLADEDDFLPWFPVMRHVEWLRKRTDHMRIDKQVQEFFLGLMGKVAKKIDFGNNGTHNEVNNKDFFTTRHNQVMHQFACDLGHPCCFARNCSAAPSDQKPPEVTYTPGLCESFENKTKDLSDPRYIKYILCSENETALWAFVNKTLTGHLDPAGIRMHIALSILIEKSNNVNYFIENANAIYGFFEDRLENPNRAEVVSDLTLKLIKAASTPEQMEQILDLVVKNPNMNPLGVVQANFIEQKRTVIQWQKINFPVITKWLQDHPINKPTFA